jgi:hypothetical protein
MTILRFIYQATACSGDHPGKSAFWYVYVLEPVIDRAKGKAESYIQKRGWVPHQCKEMNLLSHQISESNVLDFPMARRAMIEGICGECYSGEELELLAG